MNKYEVQWYNNIGGKTVLSHVIAENEEDAREIICEKWSYATIINIDNYCEPKFLKRENKMGDNRENVIGRFIAEQNNLNNTIKIMAEIIKSNINCQCRFCNFNDRECEHGECVDGIIKYFKSKGENK